MHNHKNDRGYNSRRENTYTKLKLCIASLRSFGLVYLLLFFAGHYFSFKRQFTNAFLLKKERRTKSDQGMARRESLFIRGWEGDMKSSREKEKVGKRCGEEMKKMSRGRG